MAEIIKGHVPEGHKISLESRRELNNVIIASLSSIVANAKQDWLRSRAQVISDGNNADVNGSPIDRYVISVFDDDNQPDALFSVMIDANQNSFLAVSQVGDEALKDPQIDNPNIRTVQGVAVYHKDDGSVDSEEGGEKTLAPIISLGAEFIANVVLEHKEKYEDNVSSDNNQDEE